ncbi:MAG: hypothetical protein ACI8PZ_004327 [Myxococcota bacterium]|jgi:hypothetical protein
MNALLLATALAALPALADDTQPAPDTATAGPTTPGPVPTDTPAGPPAPSREVSTSVSVLPGLGWNAGGSERIDGAAVGLVAHHHSVDGVEASLASWVDHGVHGAHLAAFVAVTGGSVRGVQASGFVGVAEQVQGFQGGGMAAVAGPVDGFQGSGFLNIARDVRGAQGSGGLNLARDVQGAQIGLLNIGRCVQGAQIGLVNVAEHVRGGQVGLLNIAKRVDGTSVGLASFIGNGLHEVDVWSSASAALVTDVKFGGKHIYTLGGVGLVRPESGWWTFGLGWGGHVPAGRGWFELDVSAWGVAEGNRVAPGVHTKLRTSAGLQLGRHFAPFVGVSANVWAGDGTVVPRSLGMPSAEARDGRAVVWPGAHAGVQF